MINIVASIVAGVVLAGATGFTAVSVLGDGSSDQGRIEVPVVQYGANE